MHTRPSQYVPTDIVSAARRVKERADLNTAVSLHLKPGERLAATMIGGLLAWSNATAAGVEFGARLMPKAMRALSA